MAEPIPPTSGNFLPEDPVRKRRSLADSEQVDSVTFARKGLSPERLMALKEFLKHATADEIASVRKQYGDTPEVLRMIGLEVLSQPAQIELEKESQR
jgi:hypothetical protein